ncbi:MAG TPA: metallopeptidase TldD-related protein [Vicinamibacterales bacterium]|nr:metallopeptidase TldD-related protein [Vicinamibacterales bacterium]
MKPARITTAVALVIALLFASAPGAQDTPLMSAMQDEMRRSMTELRLPGEPGPYYVEYEVNDLVSMRAVARLGGIVDDLADRGRTLQVQVRVGDYAFDNSRFITQDRGARAPALSELTASLDDNYDAMRQQLWLTTDAAYKHAVNVFARKKATFQNRTVADAIPDFSRDTPNDVVETTVAPRPQGREWVERARELSAIFAATGGLEGSEVWLSETHGNRYYLNSEGSKTVTPVGSAYLRIAAEAQAEDGATVRDLVVMIERTLDDLPPMEQLRMMVADVANRTRIRRSAGVGEEFTGPVLVEGQASAQLVRQTLVPLLLARRPADAENQRFGQGQGQATPFLTRIGLRVLTDSFFVSDTPSVRQLDGRPVAGAYLVDDEGVLAKDVSLVEKGRLVTLLTGRTPQRRLLKSTGHGRSGTVHAGVFQMSSTEAIPLPQLKTKYLDLLKLQDKSFGYIVRSIAPPGEAPGGQGGGPVILDIVKVTLDGREEPVRGLRFGDVPPSAFRDILEASQERTLENYRINVVGAASVIAPSMIFEELEIEQTREIVQKPPLVPSPLAP